MIFLLGVESTGHPPMTRTLSEQKAHPVQLLKITALNTEDKQKVKDIGKRLESVANPLNINFLYDVVTVDDMSYPKKELFDIQSGRCPFSEAINNIM